MCNLCKYNNGEYKSLCLDCKKEQDKILKVVESVLKEHGIISTSAKYITCNCLLKFDDSSFYKEHIYQEIKNAIESTNLPKSQDKSTNLEQVQDKKGKDEKEK